VESLDQEDVEMLDAPTPISNQEKLFRFKNNENILFTAPVHVLKMSNLFKNMIEGNENDDIKEDADLPVVSVSAPMLNKAIEYMTHYDGKNIKKLNIPIVTNNLCDFFTKWDDDFMNVDVKTIFEIIKSSNYLDIPCLLQLSCAKIASLIKGKSPEEIKKILGVPEDNKENEASSSSSSSLHKQ